MWSSKSVVPSLCVLLIICSAIEVIGIHGGRFARLGAFPHHCSVHVDGVLQGSGSLISEDFVLTAAQIITNDIRKYTVVCGAVDIKDTKAQTFLPESLILHDDYSPITFDFDIGLIRLMKPAIINKNVQVINLAPNHATYLDDTVGSVTGYGDIDDHKTRQNCLKWAVLPLWSPATCLQFDGFNEHMLCGGLQDAHATPCEGDTGGGFVVQHLLVGVYFMGFGCGRPHFPTIYSSVPFHYEWIVHKMNDYSARHKKWITGNINDHSLRHKNCQHFNLTQKP